MPTTTTTNRPAYVYMLRCADDSLYTGWTYDVAVRVTAHKAGKGGKYTRSKLPVALARIERFQNKSAAMKREAAIKKMSRKRKLELINGLH